MLNAFTVILKWFVLISRKHAVEQFILREKSRTNN